MRLKLFFILIVVLGYLTLTVTYNTASSLAPSSLLTKTSVPLDGTDPPHAVDTSGKAIPNQSVTQPDKPIILAKDIDDPKYGELKPESAFDHTKHSTDVMYSRDGKTVTTCFECHHTEQPMPVADKPYLKKSERTAALTAKQLETSKQPVKSCRACHFQAAADETDEYPPKGVTYPKEMGKQPSGKFD